jgi:ribose transport system substrate-binding protein
MDSIGGKGNIVMIYNDLGAMIRTRISALHDVLGNYPNVQIVASFVYAWPDFLPDVKAKMEAVLQAHSKPGDIVGVFAPFDGAGVAADQAVRELGLQKYISIVGIDGDPEAYKAMQLPDASFKFTEAQDPDRIARETVDAVFELLKGNKIPERIIYVPGQPITKDNIPAGS